MKPVGHLNIKETSSSSSSSSSSSISSSPSSSNISSFFSWCENPQLELASHPTFHLALKKNNPGTRKVKGNPQRWRPQINKITPREPQNIPLAEAGGWTNPFEKISSSNGNYFPFLGIRGDSTKYVETTTKRWNILQKSPLRPTSKEFRNRKFLVGTVEGLSNFFQPEKRRSIFLGRTSSLPRHPICRWQTSLQILGGFIRELCKPWSFRLVLFLFLWRIETHKKFTSNLKGKRKQRSKYANSIKILDPCKNGQFSQHSSTQHSMIVQFSSLKSSNLCVYIKNSSTHVYKYMIICVNNMKKWPCCVICKQKTHRLICRDRKARSPWPLFAKITAGSSCCDQAELKMAEILRSPLEVGS